LLPDIFAPEVQTLIGATGEVGIEMLAEKRIRGLRNYATGAEPSTDGGAKAFLFAMDDLGGQELFGGALEEVFGGFPPELERVRQATSKIGDLDIEEGTANFERVHHAGAVGFREDAILQVDFGVELQGPIHRIGCGARLPGLDRLAVDFLDRKSGLREARKVGGFERSEPNGIPKPRGMIEPSQGAFDFKIEADVFVGNGEAGCEETEGCVEGTRDCFFVKRGDT
jgi:hypothetical protein